MRPIVRRGLEIIIVSLLIAVGVTFYFYFTKQSFSLTMLVLPSVGFIFGIGLMIGGFGTFLGIEDEIENFDHLVRDDVEDFMTGRFTYTHFKLVLTIIAILSEAFFLFTYQKWTATWWGGVPVIVVAVVCIVLIVAGGLTMRWFQNRIRRTRWWVFALFFVGWLASAYFGIYRTEPINFREMPEIERQNYTYNYRSTRAGSTSSWIAEDGFDAFDFFDCSGDDCAEVLLFVVIVIIVLICIAASAYIPHFWVVATCILITAMAIVTLRELLMVDATWTSEKQEIEL